MPGSRQQSSLDPSPSPAAPLHPARRSRQRGSQQRRAVAPPAPWDAASLTCRWGWRSPRRRSACAAASRRPRLRLQHPPVQPAHDGSASYQLWRQLGWARKPKQYTWIRVPQTLRFATHLLPNASPAVAVFSGTPTSPNSPPVQAHCASRTRSDNSGEQQQNGNGSGGFAVSRALQWQFTVAGRNRRAACIAAGGAPVGRGALTCRPSPGTTPRGCRCRRRPPRGTPAPWRPTPPAWLQQLAGGGSVGSVAAMQGGIWWSGSSAAGSRQCTCWPPLTWRQYVVQVPHDTLIVAPMSLTEEQMSSGSCVMVATGSCCQTDAAARPPSLRSLPPALARHRGPVPPAGCTPPRPRPSCLAVVAQRALACFQEAAALHGVESEGGAALGALASQRALLQAHRQPRAGAFLSQVIEGAGGRA